MTTNPLTWIACSLLIGTIAACSIGLVSYSLSPWWRPWLGSWLPVADIVAMLLAYGILSGFAVRAIAARWPLPAGLHAPGSPVWGRWQLLTVVSMFGQWALRPFTLPVNRPLIARLFGARVGPAVAIGGAIDDPWMVSLGEGAVLGNASLLSGHLLTGGRLLIGRVEIGAGALVGANAIVTPGCRLGEQAQALAGAVLMPRSVIPAGESWRGNPASAVMPVALTTVSPPAAGAA